MWLRWLEHYPVHQKAAGSTLSQGTWFMGSNPSQGAYRRQPIDVSLSPPCSSLPLESMGISSGRDLKKEELDSIPNLLNLYRPCLLYTSDAADDWLVV